MRFPQTGTRGCDMACSLTREGATSSTKTRCVVRLRRPLPLESEADPAWVSRRVGLGFSIGMARAPVGSCPLQRVAKQGVGPPLTHQTAFSQSSLPVALARRSYAGVSAGSQMKINIYNLEKPNETKPKTEIQPERLSTEQRLSPCNSAGGAAGVILLEEMPWLEALAWFQKLSTLVGKYFSFTSLFTFFFLFSFFKEDKIFLTCKWS